MSGTIKASEVVCNKGHGLLIETGDGYPFVHAIRPTSRQLLVIEEKHTYSCAVAKGPLMVAVTMLEFQKHPPILYTQLSGLWMLKGNADAVFIDNTGTTVFEWHPRRTLKPRCVARTLDGQFPTTSIPFSIYSSRLVSSLNPSKILCLPSPMSPKRATYSDEPANGYWPTTLDYGEPCAYRKTYRTSVHEDAKKIIPPAHLLGKQNSNAARSTRDKDRGSKLQLLTARSLRPSGVSALGAEARNSSGNKAIMKRQRESDDENHDHKRRRTSYDYDSIQTCHPDDDPIASIKKETIAPVSKRRRDDDNEGPTIKRQRLKPEDEDVQMVDVDSELDLDI